MKFFLQQLNLLFYYWLGFLIYPSNRIYFILSRTGDTHGDVVQNIYQQAENVPQSLRPIHYVIK